MEHINRFLRYPGSKRKMLDFLVKFLPQATEISGRYAEPFVGGCAVFFSICPTTALLSDINPDLIELLSAIKLNPSAVWKVYCSFGDTKEAYKFIRDQFSPTNLIEKAARVLYLNRTCFKGMWRTNLKGGFNVGYGGQDRRWAINEKNLIEVSNSFGTAEFKCEDFENVISSMESRDFIFLDPPYRPGEKELLNEHYIGKTFKFDDHVRLSKSLQKATKKKVKWAMTTSSHQEITGLFKSNYMIAFPKGTGARPGIMSVNSGEVLITNYPISGGIKI